MVPHLQHITSRGMTDMKKNCFHSSWKLQLLKNKSDGKSKTGDCISLSLDLSFPGTSLQLIKVICILRQENGDIPHGPAHNQKSKPKSAFT